MINREKPEPLNRQQMAADFKREFRVTLLYYGHYECYRDDVTVHGYSPTYDKGNCIKIDLEFRRNARLWFQARGLQFAQQFPYAEVVRRNLDYTFLGDLRMISLKRGYHATTRQRWDRISQEGLIPSNQALQMSVERHDTEGNIYFCEKLGTIHDAGQCESLSAYWWRDHLCEQSTENSDLCDWLIIEANLEGLQVHQDMFSKSGLIVSTSIPPERLKVAFMDDQSTS